MFLEILQAPYSDSAALLIKRRNMSVVDLESLYNDNLKKRIASLVSLDDWSDECRQYGRPSLLHKGGPCTRKEREPLDTVIKIWSELRERAKPILNVEVRLQEGSGRRSAP